MGVVPLVDVDIRFTVCPVKLKELILRGRAIVCRIPSADTFLGDAIGIQRASERLTTKPVLRHRVVST